MDTNTMIVWIIGILALAITAYLVAQKFVISKGADGWKLEFERKVDEKMEVAKLQSQEAIKKIENNFKLMIEKEITERIADRDHVASGKRIEVENNKNVTTYSDGEDIKIKNCESTTEVKKKY